MIVGALVVAFPEIVGAVFAKRPTVKNIQTGTTRWLYGYDRSKRPIIAQELSNPFNIAEAVQQVQTAATGLSGEAAEQMRAWGHSGGFSLENLL